MDDCSVCPSFNFHPTIFVPFNIHLELDPKPSYLPQHRTAQVRSKIGNTMKGGCNWVQYDVNALSGSIVLVMLLYQLPLRWSSVLLDKET
jgi:hypothetical protein